MKPGQKVRLTKRRTGEIKGNPYMVLAVTETKAKLKPGQSGDEKWFDLRDLS